MKALACHINKPDPSQQRLKQQYQKTPRTIFVSLSKKSARKKKNKKGILLRYTQVGEDLSVLNLRLL